MKAALKLSGILLLAAIVLWFGRRPLHRQYQQIAGICTSKFAEVLDKVDLEQSPRAHALLADFAQLGRYRAADRLLPPFASGRVVFYGDSITDFWPTAYPNQFFPGRRYIGRGISGQSTPEMVWRLQQDVLDLHPATLVLLAGINDVILPERHISSQETQRNIQTIVELAEQQHIRVILCSILPISHFPQPRQAAFTEQIRSLNQWLQTYAAKEHLTYVDFYAAMSTPAGTMQDRLTKDGVHPNASGYELMRSMTQQAIDGVAIKPGTTP